MSLPLLSDAKTAAGAPAEGLPPGSRLMAGQFEIERFLNSGGFALIYLVRDSLGRPLVVKECFPADLCRRSGEMVVEQNPDQTHTLDRLVGLFLQEARTLAELDHPGVVRVHQVFEENNTAYMVMDYVDGPDLLDMIDDPDTNLSPAKVERLLTDVLSAVAYLHSQGVLHRDLSPDNIMIGEDGAPVLIDFGASRGQIRPNQRNHGSLRVVKDGYSAKELYSLDGTQEEASDLYGLAATFYHLVTGQMPAAAPDRQTALAAGEPDPYLPLSTVAEGYSLELIETVDQALSLDPAGRPASAKDWLNVLSPVRKAQLRDRVSRGFWIASLSLISLVGLGVALTDPARSSERILELVEGASAALADPYAYSAQFAQETPQIALNEVAAPALGPAATWQNETAKFGPVGALPTNQNAHNVALTLPTFPNITLPTEEVSVANSTPLQFWNWSSTQTAADGEETPGLLLTLEAEQ